MVLKTWTLWKVHQKHMECLEIRCWKRMEFNCTICVRNEVLPKGWEDMNILHTIEMKEG